MWRELCARLLSQQDMTSPQRLIGQATPVTRRFSLLRDQKSVLVTLDKDFGELAISKGRLHHGIIPLVNLASRQQAASCVHVLETHGDDLLKGAIITVETGRLRVRAP